MIIFDNKTKTNKYEQKNYFIRRFDVNLWHK